MIRLEGELVVASSLAEVMDEKVSYVAENMQRKVQSSGRVYVASSSAIYLVEIVFVALSDRALQKKATDFSLEFKNLNNTLVSFVISGTCRRQSGRRSYDADGNYVKMENVTVNSDYCEIKPLDAVEKMLGVVDAY